MSDAITMTFEEFMASSQWVEFEDHELMCVKGHDTRFGTPTWNATWFAEPGSPHTFRHYDQALAYVGRSRTGTVSTGA